MKITCLVENTTTCAELTPKHGLSLYIETCDTTLLFDMGPDETFIDNAHRLGLDLTKVDTAVISHGHYDHGGGIPYFQRRNKTAPIFMTQKAWGKFYAMAQASPPRYIGMDHEAIDRAQCEFITSDLTLSNFQTLFTGFSTPGFIPKTNEVLYAQSPDGTKKRDKFPHELALLIRENEKTVLVTGCSHSGIGNMLTTVLNRTGLTQIDHVIGGFHLYTPSARQTESNDRLDLLAAELLAHPHTQFHTGHCTGPDAPDYLNKIMNTPVSTFSTGSQIVI